MANNVCRFDKFCDDKHCDKAHTKTPYPKCDNFNDCDDKECVYRHSWNNPCYSFMKDKKSCDNDNCKFSHDEEDIAYWTERNAKLPPKFLRSTEYIKPCKYGKYCKFGRECRFDHSRDYRNNRPRDHRNNVSQDNHGQRFRSEQYISDERSSESPSSEREERSSKKRVRSSELDDMSIQVAKLALELVTKVKQNVHESEEDN